MFTPQQMKPMDKKELLNVLKQLGDLPYKSQVIQETFASLPTNLAQGLAYKMYLKYYYKGEVYAMESIHMTGARNLFTSVNSMVKFMNDTSFPDARAKGITDVIDGLKDQYFHHRFYVVRKEDI
jgi:hypothetical protein